MRHEHTHARAAADERNAIGSIKLRLRKAEAAERGEEEDNIEHLGGAKEKGEGGGMNAMKFNSSEAENPWGTRCECAKITCELCEARTVRRMAPLTRFPNNAPEPPGNSANTVYMITMSHFLDAPTARTRAHRTAERTVTRKLAAQGVPYMHRKVTTLCFRKSFTHFADTAVK